MADSANDSDDGGAMPRAGRVKPRSIYESLRAIDGLLYSAPDSAQARDAWRSLFSRYSTPGGFAALPVGDAALLVDVGLRLHMIDGEYERAGALIDLLFSHPRAGRLGKAQEAIFRCKKGEALLAAGREREGEALAQFAAVAAGIGDGRYHRDAIDNVVYRLYEHVWHGRGDREGPPSRALADFVGRISDAFGDPAQVAEDGEGGRPGPPSGGGYGDLAARLESAFSLPEGWRDARPDPVKRRPALGRSGRESHGHHREQG